MKTYFVSHVLIVVEANSESEAADVMSEALTGNLMFSGIIHDWQYQLDVGDRGGHSVPEFAGHYEDTPSEDEVIGKFLDENYEQEI